MELFAETECSPERTREVASELLNHIYLIDRSKARFLSSVHPQSLDPSLPALAEPSEAPPPEDDAPPLRPLTSLNWPYVPEESAYPDPLKRDDPKALQVPQYEAIATSPAVRKTLVEHPNLPALLRSIDTLRGPDREDALHRALGVSAPDISGAKPGAGLSDDVLALRALAEAVEAAVRGGKEGSLGLDWEGT
ncbi:unnamed protein product [Mycena citricolor]|uniref:Uncharacterized protein n=1 Tax=Mycena citricolor TaxID=2018698 RepID=A0AAD2GXM4_9AGAR|nr:unnamed protein product [Mycena citricolor]